MTQISAFKAEHLNQDKTIKNILSSDVIAVNKGSSYRSKYIELEGNNSYLEITSNVSYDFTSEFVIEFIANINSTNDRLVIDKSGVFNIYIAGNSVFVEVETNSGTYTKEFYISRKAINYFRHFYFNFDLNSSSIRLFINGVEATFIADSGTLGAAFSTSVSDIIIGSKTAITNSTTTSFLYDYISFYNLCLDSGQRSQRFEVVRNYLEYKYKEDYVYAEIPVNNTAFYKFTGNADDSSINNNHATLQGTATITSGNLVTGDNNTDYLAIPVAAINNFTNFSIATWAKITNLHTGVGYYNTLVSCANGATLSGDDLIVYYDANIKKWILKFLGFSQIISLTNDLIEDGLFHHIAIVKQNKLARIYIDGILYSETTITTGALVLPVGGFMIGQDQDDTNSNFDANQSWAGEYDNFCVFSKSLNIEEILMTKEYPRG